MKPRKAKSRTADLFAAADASPERPVLSPPTFTPSFGPTTALERPASPRSWEAGGIPPTPQTAAYTHPTRLWYAVVFPELADEQHCAAVLQRLCLHAQRFTSFVSIEPPNALLLEIKGSLKLFGPLETLHAAIDAGWRRLALSAHSATAPSTLAALWIARCGPLRAASSGGAPLCIEDPGALAGHLAKLPIACTAWDVELLQTLRALGVMRMGELLRLPRAGLARRLGTAAVQDLDIALGRQSAPRRVFVPRERFRARCDLETEIENTAYLEKALEPLIGRCAQFLRERQAGVQALRLKLRHRAGPATCVHLGLASITSERRRLMDVLTQKLGGLELRAPVRGMELSSGSLQPLSSGSLDVFAGLAAAGMGAGRGRDGAPQLVERLRARLGEDAVYGVASIPEHRPEAAWRRVHELLLISAPRMREAMADQSTDGGMPRPVWLLDSPLPLPLPESESESDMQCHQSGLILAEGPERIESGWWDGNGVARDYYVAHQGGGRKPKQKLWIFQERQSKRWYLHGMFA
jgi:protein ImuB